MSTSRDNTLQIVIISVVLATLINYILLTNPFIQEAVGINLQGSMDTTDFSNPDYDSGWTDLSDRIVVEFTHNLGTSDIFVYVLAKWDREWEGSGGPMVHQFYYGGDRYGDPEQTQGFYWDTYTENPNMIEVSCYERADEIRVLIWKLP